MLVAQLSDPHIFARGKLMEGVVTPRPIFLSHWRPLKTSLQHLISSC